MKSKARYLTIAIEDIRAPIRELVKSGDVRELAKSIDEDGLVNALWVIPSKRWEGIPPMRRYTLVAGFRRLLAVMSLGWTHVNVLVISQNDAKLHAALHERGDGTRKKVRK